MCWIALHVDGATDNVPVLVDVSDIMRLERTDNNGTNVWLRGLPHQGLMTARESLEEIATLIASK